MARGGLERTDQVRIRVATIAALLALGLGVLGLSTVSAKTFVSKASVLPFQAAGSEGGGVLTPGDVFPPDNVGHATLQRKTDSVTVNIHTSGLPAGAYTL